MNYSNSQDIDRQLEIILRGIDTILGKDDLIDKLKQNRPLKVKVGFDPTASDLHFGHLILLNKMKQLQELGHEIIFLVGDFTAKIGDPTGKNVTRLPLSDEQIAINLQSYVDQVGNVLDKNNITIAYNSSWLKDLTLDGIIKLMSTTTVARMLERDDFSKRFRENLPICLHEFLYPIMQGYDSVALCADIELGGTDQRFNLLVGRDLQRHYGMKEQAVIMLPLLEGLDGVNKMSKSLGNYIGISEDPVNMFGKIMSISDQLMWKYIYLLSNQQNLLDVAANYYNHEQYDGGGQLQYVKDNTNNINPRDIKVQFALEMITRLHSEQDARFALNDFETKFKHKGIPEDIESFELELTNFSDQNNIGYAKLIKILEYIKMVDSSSEARRMIEQSAVTINHQRISKNSEEMQNGLAKGVYIIQIGKRKFAKVTIL